MSVGFERSRQSRQSRQSRPPAAHTLSAAAGKKYCQVLPHTPAEYTGNCRRSNARRGETDRKMRDGVFLTALVSWSGRHQQLKTEKTIVFYDETAAERLLQFGPGAGGKTFVRASHRCHINHAPKPLYFICEQRENTGLEQQRGRQHPEKTTHPSSRTTAHLTPAENTTTTTAADRQTDRQEEPGLLLSAPC